MFRLAAIPHWRAATFVVAALLGIGFLPLFGGPGYEHSLATGLLVPSVAAIATARSVARSAGEETPLASFSRGILLGLALAFLSLLTAFVHAARVGICEIGGALVYFGLTAATGAAMGGAWGAVAGHAVLTFVSRGYLTKSTRANALAILLAVAGPVGSAVISVVRFVTSPMIFAYDPFVGYFSGTLYDTVVDAGPPMLTYRLGSLATLVSAALFASLLTRKEPTTGLFTIELHARGARGRALVGLLAALASIATIACGTRLGHFSTVESITTALGSTKHGVRCDVVFPSTTREQEATLLLKDCEEQLAAVEKRLDAHGPPRVHAFFFRDADEKKRLMGAAHTYIAKPWREEVYLQLGGYPHPVLGHELGHVVAGSFGRGPFRIAGSLGGIVPNPGLIEGVAVAAAPDDDDLDGATWARAMKDIGVLPSMQHVFSLGFLEDASSKSYTLAGAFVTWIGLRFGLPVIHAWYGGASIEALTNLDWPRLDAEFRAHLDTLKLSGNALSIARAKFDKPGIFGRKCPHLVDALRHQADTCRDTQRYEEALRLYRQAIAKDAHDFASQKDVANLERRHGNRAHGRAALEALANADEKQVPRTYKDRAEEALADAAFIDGDFGEAAARYDTLIQRTVDEDVARTLEVKALGAADPNARAAVQTLLLGDERHGPHPFASGVDLGTWNVHDPTGLSAYLIGRNFVNHGHYERAAVALEKAIGAPLPSRRIAREALRQRAIVACAMDDRDGLARVMARIAGPDDPFRDGGGGRRASVLELVTRCTH